MRLPLIAWEDVTAPNDEIIRWEAEEIARRFRLKRDEHVGLVKARGIETGGSSTSEALTIRADIPRPSTTLSTFIKLSPDDGDAGRNMSGEMLWLQGDGSDSFIAEDQPAELIEVFESITYQKSADATWNFMLDYVILEEPMRFPQEDYLADMYTVDRQNTAGNPFFQPGRNPGQAFHQVKREHGD